MDQNITLEGREYELVKEQRSGVSVYKTDDTYARIGLPAQIERNIRSHRAMEKQGFPVAPVLSSGSLGEREYFIEQSLGEKTFSATFREEYERSSAVSDQQFQEFLRITKRYLIAQSKAVVEPDPEGFATGVHLDILRKELPQYSISLRDKFNRVLQKMAGFPYVLSHGDFNPANMYPLGVIDLEDAFTAPFGFDAVSAVSTVEWFPTSPDFEYFAHYRFSDEQKAQYLSMCDTVSLDAGYSAISAYYGDFAFCRAVWSLVRMHEWPKLQTWRYEKFIKTYLFS